MKSLLIFVLLLALAAAAFFTRPSAADFKQFIVSRQTAGDDSIKRVLDTVAAERFADTCEFNDRLLWVNVRKDGKSIYTGAFSHWFSHDQVQHDVGKVEQTVKSAGQEIDRVRIEAK